MGSVNTPQLNYQSIFTNHLPRARATSAAPSYFKTFRSKRNGRGYLDGALYHNNPVQVADLERRLIWPDRDPLPPDILLSIGTSCNNSIRQEAQNNLHVRRQESDPLPSRSISRRGGKQRSILKRRKTIPMSKMLKVLKNRVENILDTEMRWLAFMSDATHGDEEGRPRYRRINPDIGEDPPKLDEAGKLPHLRRRMHQITKYGDFQKQVGDIARQLVASCFYIEVPHLPSNPQNLDTIVSGTDLPIT